MVRESSVSLAVAIRQSARFTKCIIICFLRLRICNLSEKTRTTYSYQSVNKMTTFQPVTKVKAKTNCNAKSFCLKSVSLRLSAVICCYFQFRFPYCTLQYNAISWRAPIGRIRTRDTIVSLPPISAQCSFLAIFAQNLALYNKNIRVLLSQALCVIGSSEI